MTKPTFIDTHAHLDDDRLYTDTDGVIERALAAGVGKLITVACYNPTGRFDRPVELVGRYDNLYLAAGIHPHDAKVVTDDTPYDLIRELAADKAKRLVAVGETGLDFHYDNSPRDIQVEVFRRHIRLARELKLPLIVHTREADEETLRVLIEEGAGEVGGVIHCFSGSMETAKQFIEMGFYLSFTGVVTFPKADELREVVKKTPVERIMVETDCPYLAPVPHRGKKCEPSHVVHTAAMIAKVKGLALEDVARVTTLNAENLFGLGVEDEKSAEVAYAIRNSLYLNITNRCSNYCTFCAKFRDYTVKGHYLRLKKEPTRDEVVRAILEAGKEPTDWDELVFCGFGEPLIRLDMVKEVGLMFRKMGMKIRIDTDGLANLYHGKNILSELRFVDTLSVSMNAFDSDSYREIVKCPYGDDAFPAILYFMKEAKKYVRKVVASVVAVPGLDIERCRALAEDELGVVFRVREYNNVG